MKACALVRLVLCLPTSVTRRLGTPTNLPMPITRGTAHTLHRSYRSSLLFATQTHWTIPDPCPVFHISTPSIARRVLCVPSLVSKKGSHCLRPYQLTNSVGTMSGAAAGRRNALAGAGLVALGAGALLCARAYRTRMSAATKESPRSESKNGSLAPRTTTPSKDAKGGAADADQEGRKTPCDGCDCGLGEAPGPLEGTMGAYERHVIICRWVEPLWWKSCGT